MIYYQDRQRHLVCKPYSKENLHQMAHSLGIKRCWYHAKPYPHYDIPKRMFPVWAAVMVDPRTLLQIIKGKA